MLGEEVPYSIIVNLCVLVLYSTIARTMSGFSLVVIGTVVIEMVHYFLSEYVLGPLAPSMSYQWQLFSWYMGFAIGDFILVALVLMTARRFELILEWPSKIVIGIYVAFGTIQVARYLDRISINTETMALVYKYGIKSLNIALSACLLGYVAYSAYHAIRYRNEYE